MSRSFLRSEIDIVCDLPFIRRIAASIKFLELIDPLLNWPDIFENSDRLLREWESARRGHLAIWDKVEELAGPKGVEPGEWYEIRRRIRMDAMRRLDLTLYGTETFLPQCVWAGSATLVAPLRSISLKRISLKVGLAQSQDFGFPPNYERDFPQYLTGQVVDEIEMALWPIARFSSSAEELIDTWTLWRSLEGMRKWDALHMLPARPFSLKIGPEFLRDGYSLCVTQDELNAAEFPLTALVSGGLPFVWSDAFRRAWELRPQTIRDWEGSASPEEIHSVLKK
jgi:hypothetical protein